MSHFADLLREFERVSEERGFPAAKCWRPGLPRDAVVEQLSPIANPAGHSGPVYAIWPDTPESYEIPAAPSLMATVQLWITVLDLTDASWDPNDQQLLQAAETLSVRPSQRLRLGPLE